MEKMIEKIEKRFSHDQELVQLFRNCFLNTYETTMKEDERGTYVITGDIPAMWLRDSAAQVRPYLLLCKEDPELAQCIKEVIQRQWYYLLKDPYANAFNQCEDGSGHQDDETEMSPIVWERKYEIDSLAYPIQLTYLFWKATGDDTVLDENWIKGIKIIMSLWKTEQNHDEQSPYRFQRRDCRQSDTLTREGLGGPSVYTGMTWSGFRPSDDACTYGFLVPSNMFASVVLAYAQTLLLHQGHHELADEAISLSEEIKRGIETYGKIKHPIYGEIYVYETDGAGGYNLMDDANVPSLLAMPYLGYVDFDDEVYQNTRRFILSRDNPYYYEGAVASGVGSPHTPDHYVWHIALAIQGMTSVDSQERQSIIECFKKTHGGKQYMHEGFNASNPEIFTRDWFAWANAMFSEFLMSEANLFVPHSPLEKYRSQQ